MHDGAAVIVNYPGRIQQAQEVVAGTKKVGGPAIAVQDDVRKVATSLATGAPEACLNREAEASVDRLTRRPSTKL